MPKSVLIRGHVMCRAAEPVRPHDLCQCGRRHAAGQAGAAGHHGAGPGCAAGAGPVRAHSEAQLHAVHPAHQAVCSHHCKSSQPLPSHELFCPPSTMLINSRVWTLPPWAYILSDEQYTYFVTSPKIFWSCGGRGGSTQCRAGLKDCSDAAV